MSRIISGTRTAEDILRAYFNRAQPADPAKPLPLQPITTVAGGLITIDDLIDNKRVYENLVNKGIPHALENAYSGVALNGIVAGMPLLIAAKAKEPKINYLWKDWFSCLGGIYSGVDTHGKHVPQGEGLVMVIHNGCLWSDPNRVRKAFSDGLNELYAGKLTIPEWDNLIDGQLPGKSIQLYTINDIKQGRIPDPLFGNYGVVLPFAEAKDTVSGHQDKSAFMSNPFALAMAGTEEHLEGYFNKASHNGQLGSWHVFNSDNFNISQPQGRLLCLSGTDNGLNGGRLDNNARFAGVVPSTGGAPSTP